MKAEFVTLLSEAEYEKYQSNIPRIKCWWWLKSSRQFDIDDNGEKVKCKFPDRINMLGFVDHNPIAIQDYVAGVRPVLKISDHNYEIGSIIGYGSNTWIYIGDDYLISDYIVLFCEYDVRNNITWDESQLKTKLETLAKNRRWLK